eukprot:TRINITY_DN12514_c0_g1_i1.p1 TRINITY_DN12514_c0_g1~~TRINITY_DN12514_c0_g1_i1.p1  ORF type:complete len:236 (+),score=67.15 TRINITY_DN12514_c0_g1_i1:843-1550(+)
MAEVKVGNAVVALTVANECQSDPALLQSISRFKPLIEWGNRLSVPEWAAVKAVEVQNATTVVGRLNSVRLSVTIASEEGDTVRESITLCDNQHAALLILVKVDDVLHTITVSGPLPAIASESHEEIPFGVSTSSFEVPYSDSLEQLGVVLQTSKHRPLVCKDGPSALYPGAVGAQAQRFYSVQLADQKAAFAEQFPLQEGDYVLRLCPIEDLARRTSSTRTLAALALMHTSGRAP